MHHIYHTEGIILGSRNFGEAGKYYYLLTRDLGLVYASAQGVRKMSSKLRFILQDFAYIKVDLVQGRDFWRITSAGKTNKLGQMNKRTDALKIFANMSHLLKRLLTGVEPNEALFTDFLRGLLVLEKAETKEALRNIEAVIVLRIINNLGYIGGDEALKTFIKLPLSEGLASRAASNRNKILREINKALKET